MLLVALGDVGREQRLVGGARELERVLGRPAAPHDEDEARHRGLQVAQHVLGGAARGLLVGAGEHDEDLGARTEVALGEHRDRGGTAVRAARVAIARSRVRQPSCAGACGCAWAISTEPPRSTSRKPTSPSRGQQLLARRELATQHRGDEGGDGVLGGALGRAHALDLRGDHVVTRRISPCAGAVRARRRRAPRPMSADAELDRLHAGGACEQGLLVRGRARGHGDRLAGAVKDDDARVEHARGGPHDGGQPGPVWTAAVISSRAARSSASVTG